MSQSQANFRHLEGLSQHERREVIEELVVAELREALYIDDEEEFLMDAGFFDLGLTSLRLSDIKQTLEEKLGREIDTSVLFRRPTARQLIDHLSD